MEGQVSDACAKKRPTNKLGSIRAEICVALQSGIPSDQIGSLTRTGKWLDLQAMSIHILLKAQ